MPAQENISFRSGCAILTNVDRFAVGKGSEASLTGDRPLVELILPQCRRPSLCPVLVYLLVNRVQRFLKYLATGHSPKPAFS